MADEKKAAACGEVLTRISMGDESPELRSKVRALKCLE
jgi:hypothetical protein